MQPEVYQQAVSLAAQRGAAGDWFTLGCVLVDMRRWGSASGCFARVVAAEPGDARAWTNWGWCAHLLGDSGLAMERLRRAIELAPGEGHPRALLCQVLTALGEDGVEAGRRGVELDGQPVNHVGFALGLMAAGQWEEGWRENEWRFQYKIPEFLTRPWRLWRGERVRHLYLEVEQGFGDTLFALRWVRLAAERVNRVSLYVQKEVYGLVMAMDVEWLPGNVFVYPLPRLLPGEVDAWCPLMSLPAALELGGPEDAGVYLGVDLGEKLSRGERYGGLRVGICWAGNPAHDNAHHRDCPLPYWLRLSEIAGVELHSLQAGAGAEQLADVGGYGLILDRGPELTNFLDTARVLAGLDLLITVDTAVGHLAGAMGVPCWLLLNRRGLDFRWPRDGERTEWYGRHRLFHRRFSEGWDDVMRRVEGELRARVSA